MCIYIYIYIYIYLFIYLFFLWERDLISDIQAGHRSRMFESRVHRVVFGPKTETVMGEWRNWTKIIIFVYQKLSGPTDQGR